jgi:nanoRNase/pAp phosphatase (c-di-AMP/oligoRNAs hydrolase)
MDMNRIARKFGGGGHSFAAGLTIRGAGIGKARILLGRAVAAEERAFRKRGKRR